MNDMSTNVTFHSSMGFEVAVIKLNQMMEVLSSAMRNGGDNMTDTFVIIEVPKLYDHRNPTEDMEAVCKDLGLPDHAVGFMTAAEIRLVLTVCDSEYDGAHCKAVVTAGLSNHVKAGDIITDMPERLSKSLEKAKERKQRYSTINIIAISDSPLSMAAKMNASIVVTEAKTVGLQSLGHEETGTTSDAIAIVCPSGEGRLSYCGTGTSTGIAMARATREAVSRALRNREDFPEPYSFVKALEEFDVTPQSMWDAAMELYIPHPDWDPEDLRRRFRSLLSVYEKDINVNSLVMGAVLLEKWGSQDRIYGLNRGEFSRDPVHLLADEMLGMQLAQYIAGTRALFEFHRFDRHKPGCIGRAGPFIDDILCGLIGGIMSSIYTEMFEGE
ncbi:MAG TPA: hypothetical protein HA366_01635 [Candidatus Methanomethylophilaceae archaeon]|nr:hypothetical protein [Candidatus Methanomethylophilaceae archaeon]